MAVTAGLIAKVGCGLGVAGMGVTGIYFGGEYINSFLSNYDRALINFLEADADHDIKFEVKKGDSALSETDLVLSETSKEVTVSAKVQVSSQTDSAFKKKGGSSVSSTDKEMSEIKGLNGGSDWTWECGFKFTKGTNLNDSSDIDTEYKNRIFKSTDKGLLGILQKELHNYTKGDTETLTKEEMKQIKIDFIRKCGYKRGTTKNKDLNGKTSLGTDDLKVEVSFEFVKKDNGSTLKPKEVDAFEHWFSEKHKNATTTGG